MRLGMMQPYFFPYLGYFGLIAASDQWVVFDTPQYIRRGWVNRNRVLSSGQQGWKYVRVPVQHAPRNTAIQEIRIADPETLSTQLLNQLDEYERQRAPFFEETRDWLQQCLTSVSVTDNLCSLLVQTLQQTCDYLQIPFAPRLFSDLQVKHPTTMQPGDWALHTAIHLQASSYVNPPGGRNLFDVSAFAAAGIELQILEQQLSPYPQGRTDFLPGLSVLDVLMWNGRGQTRQLINDYQLQNLPSSSAA